ncbi:hypothetical protein D4A81_11055 [Lachnoanaerobaculum umeaense]|uniref:Uncharacterized protein n=1 Tax=Lachnoanaerobaculum umeaense TaxID=617123 RepID=A0A385Q2H1_9FIRM|nr:glycoside hydrolase family 3 C-terminal domain-containing protein [Lachnoanaerobaculum umeaense]AYB00416.1 hypothetical protein D4A81_11055 [Lachnoanaerobaculum umeaense]PZW99815.1 glycosyl hydrolase family 3 [Lachnoanaerobaculum umeaense]
MLIPSLAVATPFSFPLPSSPQEKSYIPALTYSKGFIFDENKFDKIDYLEVESKKHLNLAREVAEESIVLLKNDGILPLNKEKIKTIGVIGPNANSRRSLDGNYHGTASRYITALEGIQDYVGEDIRVLYSVGCELSSEKSEVLSAKPYDRISEALSVADYCDVIVLCLGLDETLEGEEGDTGNAYFSGDKKDLLLPKPQQILLDALLNLNKPMIVSIFSGSAMDLRIAQNANALLQTWYPGAMGGSTCKYNLWRGFSECKIAYNNI